MKVVIEIESLLFLYINVAAISRAFWIINVGVAISSFQYKNAG